MSLGLKESLSVLVRAKYAAAKAAGALTYADSHLAIVSIGGVPFQLRYCPSLAKKPTDQKPKDLKAPKTKTDPFENPDPDLFVCNAPDREHASHFVVLNKFPIIRNHFILATTSAKLLQNQILGVDDIVRTYECLKDWNRPKSSSFSDDNVFAFFNSGEHSGASQPHRHVQFLPINDMREGNNKDEWKLLLQEILEAPKTEFASYEFHIHPKLPFVHFGKTLPSQCDKQTLWTTYMDLYKTTLAAVRHFRTTRPEELEVHLTEDQSCPISYNLAMTLEGMVMCPRKKEGKMMRRADGSEMDYVALNATLLGGTLMVKNEELYDALRQDSTRLESVLETIGIESIYAKFDQEDLNLDTAALRFTL